MMANDRLFVITGGPGSGKTTLLLELEQRGFLCSQEVARQIIQEQVSTSGDGLPWANMLRYTQLMLDRSVAAYREHTPAPGIVFMDRGIPDAACYARLIGLPPFEDLERACEAYRYNKMVFMGPPWKEIYATDSERKQTYAEAVATYERWPRFIRNMAIGPSNCPGHLRYRELSLSWHIFRPRFLRSKLTLGDD
ncbi:MAG: AAA family ATPase [Bryobacteraceae bacterium]